MECRRQEGHADAEEEQNELRRLTEEAGEWMKLGGLLMEELRQKREEKVEERTKERKKSKEVMLNQFKCSPSRVTLKPFHTRAL